MLKIPGKFARNAAKTGAEAVSKFGGAARVVRGAEAVAAHGGAARVARGAEAVTAHGQAARVVRGAEAVSAHGGAARVARGAEAVSGGASRPASVRPRYRSRNIPVRAKYRSANIPVRATNFTPVTMGATRVAPPPKAPGFFAQHGKKVAAGIAAGAIGFGMMNNRSGKAVDPQSGLPRGTYGY